MIWLASFFLLLPTVHAATESDSGKTLALKQNKLLNMQHQQEALLAELIQLNKKIKKQTIKLGELQKDIDILQAKIGIQENEIQTTSKMLVESKKRLTAKIKAISKIKSGNLLQVALVHSSLSDIEKSAKLLGIVASYDVQFINDYYEKKLALGKELKDLASRFEAMKEKEIQLAKHKEVLEKDSQLRLAWLEQVKRSRLFTESQIVQLKRDKKNAGSIEDLGVFDIFSKETIVKNKGLLQPPIQGEISQNYGIKSTQESVIINHSGIFLETNETQPVKALFNAEVVYSGSIESLGRVLVLDHGDNYYSVYGNLDNVGVRPKQVVRTGEVIANSIFSPLFEGNGIYFEIRHYSQSLNPKDWIRSIHENQ